MHDRWKEIIAIGIASILALKLFSFGLSYPLEYRVRGDAYTYLVIADQFKDFSDVLAYAGDRTVGFPFFDFIVGKIVSVFTVGESPNLLTWANAVGIALLIIHLVTAWLFSGWARNTNLIKSDNTRLVLFVFFATYPALVGHTTSPLSDTLAVDLFACALVALHSAISSEIRYKTALSGTLAAFLFGASILVRPGNLLPVAAALLAGVVLAYFIERRKAVVIGAIGLGTLLTLTPYYNNCAQKYDAICLQSPNTFNFVPSAQAGLRGARILWNHLSPGQIPILPDSQMYSNYYERCRLERITGFDDTSLTGCLISRPYTLPAFLVKKWIGLFDHYRFTPYLEEATPLWLRWVSRTYDLFTWIGFAFCLLLPLQAIARRYREEIKENLIAPVTPALLVVYSAVLLAQHTALHTEDRYGFPLIPLCAVMLMVYGEKLVLSHQSHGFSRTLPWALYGAIAGVVFLAQTVIWDNAVYY